MSTTSSHNVTRTPDWWSDPIPKIISVISPANKGGTTFAKFIYSNISNNVPHRFYWPRNREELDYFCKTLTTDNTPKMIVVDNICRHLPSLFDLVVNHRHKNVTVIFIIQSLLDLQPRYRRQVNYTFLLKDSNESNLKRYYDMIIDHSMMSYIDFKWFVGTLNEYEAICVGSGTFSKITADLTNCRDIVPVDINVPTSDTGDTDDTDESDISSNGEYLARLLKFEVSEKEWKRGLKILSKMSDARQPLPLSIQDAEEIIARGYTNWIGQSEPDESVYGVYGLWHYIELLIERQTESSKKYQTIKNLLK